MSVTISLLGQTEQTPLTLLQKQFSISQLERYEFIALESTSLHFEKVERVIRQTLEPLYGNQDSSIEKIKACDDRKTELLLYNDKPVAFIIYKKEKQNEFSEYGIEDSFELKTFLVIDQEKNTEKEYDTLLLNRVFEIAREKFALNIHLTAPEQYDAEFFISRGFSVIRTWKDKYVQGVTEHLLSFSISEKSNMVKVAGSTQKISNDPF
ncbi:MAG: hypothetical protein H6620_08330 [Halobacteriovoraceae bacterium]|nr:hypothetical protein [Halobacteriovoraceae bacterium]